MVSANDLVSSQIFDSHRMSGSLTESHGCETDEISFMPFSLFAPELMETVFGEYIFQMPMTVGKL